MKHKKKPGKRCVYSSIDMNTITRWWVEHVLQGRVTLQGKKQRDRFKLTSRVNAKYRLPVYASNDDCHKGLEDNWGLKQMGKYLAQPGLGGNQLKPV